MGSIPPPLEPDGEPAEADRPHGGHSDTTPPGSGGHEGHEGGWVAPGAAPGWAPPPGPGPGSAATGWGAPGYQTPVNPSMAGSARTRAFLLHPMTFGDLLDDAFRLLKANLPTIVVITAVIFVPLELIRAFVTRNSLGGQGILIFLQDPTSAEQRQPGGGNVFASLVPLLVTPFVGAAVTRVVTASYFGDRLSAEEAIKTIGRRFWALLGAAVFVHVLEGIGLLLCLLPVLVVMAFLICTTPAIVVEGLGPVKGMRRSVALVRPRFWPVLAIAVTSGLMTWLLTAVLGTPFTLVGALIGPQWGFLLVALGAIVPALLAAPFVSIVAALVYLDARIRHEGFDLQMIARDLASGA